MANSMDMEMETYMDPSSVTSDDEMQEVWVEEIVIEEDGNPVSSLSNHGETSPWNPRDVLVLSPRETLSSVESSWNPRDVLVLNDDSLSDAKSTESDVPSNSPSYILPDSLTDEENGLLDESFQLMEDLMSKKDVTWKHDMGDDEGDVVSKAQALLDQLDYYVKQEPLSCEWLEEKTDIPLLDEIGGYYSLRQTTAPIIPYHAKYPTPIVGQIAPVDSGLTLLTSATLPSYQAQVPELPARTSLEPLVAPLSDVEPISEVNAPLTPALIREFETVLHQTLTPPHTPPQYLDLVNNQEEESKSNDLGEDELDALINSQVASLYQEKPRFEWAQPQQDSPPSTEESDSAVNSSSESDPEWAPSPQTPRNSRQRNRRAVSSVEERKMRKKEQNKNAATRYRMKKKQEQAGIVGEESVLLDKNIELKEKATELQREVKYLKSLMRDICKAKGLL